MNYITSEIPESTVLETPDEVRNILGTSRPGVNAQIDAITNDAIEVQQSASCCGVTSLAYAFTALGYPTKVDDFFKEVNIATNSVVSDGMTVPELHDVCSRYVHRMNLDLFVEGYHFYSEITDVDRFTTALQAEAEAGIDDIVIFAFHSHLAHGWGMTGTGHWSVLIGITEDNQDLVMADVNKKKYGRFWKQTVEHMFLTMNGGENLLEMDPKSPRGGIIRIGRTDRMIKRPLKGLTVTVQDWLSPIEKYDRNQLSRYIPKHWDVNLGVKNMQGMCALSASVRYLLGDDHRFSHMDNIMQEFGESFTYHLDNFMRPMELHKMASRISNRLDRAFKVRRVKITSFSADKVKTALTEAEVGTEGVVVLAALDYNSAIGCEVLGTPTGEHLFLEFGNTSWQMIAGLDSVRDVVAVAAPDKVIYLGRIWGTSVEKLAKGMNDAKFFKVHEDDELDTVIVNERKRERMSDSYAYSDEPYLIVLDGRN